jgi:xylulokinase
MQYFLGIDIGTSGAKTLLIDQRGQVIQTAAAEYPLYSPYPLWSEQDPDDWWQAARQTIRQVIASAGIPGESITAIGLTGQMHGAVFLDRDARVIRRALLWNDQRTQTECEQITRRVGAESLIKIAGNPALTGFQAPKILWLRNNEPENYARVSKVLLPKDFIRLKLTGDFASDCSDAAGTLLLDLVRRDWSRDLLQKMEIPRDWLPAVYEGSQVTGTLLASAAADLGLPAGIPVVAGGGDNAAAAVGTGIVRSGLVSSSIGTSGVIFAHSDEINLDPQGRLHTFCHAVPGKNHLMAVTLSAGNSFRWLRDLFNSAAPGMSAPASAGLTYTEMTTLAADIPPGSEGLIFLPYLTGERTPHLDPLASGAFIGLTSRHTPSHLARAVMEGVTFSLRDGIEIMRGLGVPVTQVRAIGGGGKSPLWCQMQADIFGCEVVNLAVEEGPAYGAALLAMAADQDAAGVSAVSERCVQTVGIRTPDDLAAAAYDRYYSVYRDIYTSLKNTMHTLTTLSTS